MTYNEKAESGIKLLIEKHVREFRVPENLNHYSQQDLEKAERQFLKYCLNQGTITEKAEGGR